MAFLRWVHSFYRAVLQPAGRRNLRPIIGGHTRNDATEASGRRPRFARRRTTAAVDLRAGHGGQVAANGKSLAGDFEAQTRRV